MQEKIINYIDSLLSEANGYISESSKNLIFKMAIKNKVFNKKDELNMLIDQRISFYNEKEKCPNCGAEKSKMLNICDSCGYVMPGAHESAISVNTLVENIENSIEAVNAIPKPGFITLFNENVHLVFLYLTIWSFAFIALLQLNFNSVSMFTFVLIFAFFTLISFIYKKAKGKIDRMELLKVFSNNFEQSKILAKRHFGNDKSVQDLLNSYAEKINQIKESAKEIKIKKIIIFALLFLSTGYLIWSIPWYSRSDRFARVREQQELEYKNKRKAELIECTKLMKPILEKSIPVKLQNNKIFGPLTENIIVKSKTLNFRFRQENFWLYDAESAGFQIIADSVLVEIKGKVAKNKPFIMELCAFDKSNNPVFYNAVLTCSSREVLDQIQNGGKGKFYLNFKSEVLPFESAETREMAFIDISLYEKTVSFNLASRFK
jgi:ABC-type multidrug transport system fused ATPase/permease subunit